MMPMITLAAHFDGKQIRLDEPFDFLPNTKVIVMVPLEGSGKSDEGWMNLSEQGLNAAYRADEPEYSLTLIREVNLEYEGR